MPPGPGERRGHSPDYQVVFPYIGACWWTVNRRTCLLDPNQVLFITAGEDYSESHPIRGMGHASVLVTPSPQLLRALFPTPNSLRAAFRHVRRAADARSHLVLRRFLYRSRCPNDALRADEDIVQLMRHTISLPTAARGSAAAPIVDRAKELLNARLGEDLTLTDVANAVGVSGAHLTTSFTASEGLPLFRYRHRLRLTRALLALSRCDDITALALDLGFCSHSHFTNAFRAHFGVSPSTLRKPHKSAGDASS